MMSRRLFLAGSATGALAFRPWRPAFAEAILTEDGLYRQPWFLDSLLELADELDAAAENGKRLAIMWELRGCSYCRDIHFVNFAQPEIEDFIKQQFDILQLNLIGDREVTDFDGAKLSEKRAAAKYGVRFTPTFQFFPERAAGLQLRGPREREVVRFEGYLEPKRFLATFRFVWERAYEKGSLADYLDANG